MIIKFNVFGKLMSVHRKGDGKAQEWQLFTESDTGIRARVYDLVIPSELSESELDTYLDDIYHEFSSDKHPNVVKIS